VKENRRRGRRDSIETTSDGAAKRRTVDFNGRVVGSVLLAAPGVWFVVTQRAHFTLGGTDGGTGTRRGTLIDAHGVDAVAIGSAIIGLAVINLALGIRSQRRIPVFWLGAALFSWPVLYGLGTFALDVYQFINSARAG
jgi:hypothetical protein